MPRFFINDDQISNDLITLSGEKAKHISKVLRQKVGDEVLVCDAKNINYDCIIKSISQGEVELNIKNKYESKSEFKQHIKLYQGLAKGDKMDTIIQKATELGIYEFIPLETAHAVVKLKGDDKVDKKIARWQKIAEEAAEQSERGIIPNVLEPMPYLKALKKAISEGIVFVCYGREESVTIREIIENNDLANAENISFFIGPEGGFAKEEIMQAEMLGVPTVLLGNRILRTETASAVVLSILQYAVM